MTLEELKSLIDKVTPSPWGPYSANVPFYADVKKPAPSLSKHDRERPTYWRIEDAQFIAAARDWLPKLIEENEHLQKALDDIAKSKYSDIVTAEKVVHTMLEKKE